MRARMAAAIVLGFVLIAAGLAYLVSTTATGTVAVEIHDVPGSWSQVSVTFSEVSARPVGAANGSGWVPIPLQAAEIDFLSLRNLTTLLALGRLAPGAYEGVRVVIDSVSGVLTTGMPVALAVPNAVLEAAVTFGLQGGERTTLTLDLDLAQSIQQTSQGWSFTPVLGAVEVG